MDVDHLVLSLLLIYRIWCVLVQKLSLTEWAFKVWAIWKNIFQPFFEKIMLIYIEISCLHITYPNVYVRSRLNSNSIRRFYYIFWSWWKIWRKWKLVNVIVHWTYYRPHIFGLYKLDSTTTYQFLTVYSNEQTTNIFFFW